MLYLLSIVECSGLVHIIHCTLDDLFWFLDRFHFEAGLSLKITEV